MHQQGFTYSISRNISLSKFLLLSLLAHTRFTKFFVIVYTLTVGLLLVFYPNLDFIIRFSIQCLPILLGFVIGSLILAYQSYCIEIKFDQSRIYLKRPGDMVPLRMDDMSTYSTSDKFTLSLPCILL